MFFLNINIKKVVVVGLIIVLPLITINMEQKPTSSNWMNTPFSFLAGLTQTAFFEFSYGVKHTTATYVNLINIKKENAELKLRNSELTTLLSQKTEIELENNRLRNLLNFKQNTKMELSAAKIIGRDLVPDHSIITVNKGANDGIKAGMAVISPQGVVGYIYKSTNLTSHVLLISDRFAVVDGLIQRSRAQGVIEGKGKGKCSLEFIERVDDISVGDVVVTGGLDNIFPKGLPVGVVDTIEKKTNMLTMIEIKPYVDPYKVEELFIVMNAQGEDLEQKIESAK